MDIKWKKYSHSLTAKVIAFAIAILCFTSAITIFLNLVETHHEELDIAFEENYFTGKSYISDYRNVTNILISLIDKYKSEEYILSGGTITDKELEREENNLYSQFKHQSKNYNPNLTDEENREKFREVYTDELSQMRDRLITEDLNQYRANLQELESYNGLIYYASDGENEFTNSPDTDKDYFKSFPSYLIFDQSEQNVYPEQIKGNNYYHWDISGLKQQDDVIYIAFTDEYLQSRIGYWQADKELVTNNLYIIAGSLLGLAVAFIYLIVVIGRKPEADNKDHLNFVDKLYNDINIISCFFLIGLWFSIIRFVSYSEAYKLILPATLIIGSTGLIFVLSLIKHIKNKTIITHTLIYTICYKIFKLISDNGTVGVKVILAVISYTLLVLITLPVFPLTIILLPLVVGGSIFASLKMVRKFNAIKEGVEKVKDGDIYHKIDLPEDGELGKLAYNINGITDGLNKAVDNKLKSERLKAELITNVSHDIRTPLTSIITYVDLLKNEQDKEKSAEYIQIIDQKADRLKVLTDDLFEASKASSGSIPVNYEKIDIVSLITQGIGEVDDKIQQLNLDFKINQPKDKVYIKADGKLLWRAIENLLSNIFKYAQKGSRVYIDIEEIADEVVLTIKNISAHELNISSDELMERFKRGDEARSSQGSGLGLSIAKSLINIQKGSFNIEIDGDLFKAIIKMPKS
ncbi:MAG: HAMP domain-containing histidine kinase [Firmicutes bacterium]|nr:HAMP domain-containing histidine kinase [Bacillota bacterium]